MIKVNVIALNETQFYRFQKEDCVLIKEIRAAYAYNPESRTHLCELTPSYFLRYLYSYIVLEDGVEVSDDKRSELDERYCYEPTDDTYMHCLTVKNLDCPKKECGEFEDMDAACEHLNANWPL